MIVYSVKVVKAIVLSASILSLAGCGGGSSSASALDNSQGSGESVNTTTSSSSTSTNSSSNADIFNGAGTASVSWTPPTQYTNGASLVVAGHHIYINAGSGFFRIGTLNNQSISNYLVQNLISGTYTIAVAAFDSNGVESALSTGVTVVVTG